MASSKVKTEARLKRKRRIRKRVIGVSGRPRLSVFRTARHMYAQVIEDTTGNTLVSASTLDKDIRALSPFSDKKEAAKCVGKFVAQRAKEKGITKVVFDRNGFLYHGRIEALAMAARESGLDF
ncbi:MAG: 50S ribosomal protein L18 [Pseudomonadota bacterium]